LYLNLKTQNLCDLQNCKIADGIYQSKLKGLKLSQFVLARQAYCSKFHTSSCSDCCCLINVAKEVMKSGIVEVPSTFRKCFQNVNYKSYNAKQRLMQLPVVIFQMSTKGQGSQKLYMVENNSGVDYTQFVSLFKELVPAEIDKSGLSRETLSGLCKLASNESDRKLIKYAACASRNLSSREAAKRYGVSNYSTLKSEVEQALETACAIRKNVMELAEIKDRSFLRTIGIDVSSSSSESEGSGKSSCCEWESESSDEADSENELDNTNEKSQSETIGTTIHHSKETDTDGQSSELKSMEHSEETCTDTNVLENHDGKKASQKDKYVTHLDPDVALNKQVVETHVYTPTKEHLALMLRENDLNWFAFVEELMNLLRQYNTDVINQVLLDFAQQIDSMDFTEAEERLIEQSRQAYLLRCRQQESYDNLSSNQVVTDSESDDPESWLNLKQLKSPAGIELIKKQRKILRQQAKRRAAKLIANNCLLKRKIPKRVSSILKEFPSIAKDVEEYVKSKRCGADAWRRTGVVTFDGNRKRGPKASFRRIHDFLRNKYNTKKISYGTVVQLCTIRNKRKLSSKRYKGLAKVTCRRSRKGFNIKFNPDTHWSCSFYKVLDLLQLSDGRNKVLLNRDDQAGFRLDTTYTHKGRGTLCHDEEITTRVDYVNSYSSTLQTTSYHIMESNTTPQACAGIVKANYLYSKNPSQHAADLRILEDHPEFKEHFEDKEVDCIRVDGGHDENPSGLEAQFLWTERHIQKSKKCTIVTTRHSGGSYLNRVELQNGCLALAHSQLFIPSTLNGSNYNSSGLDPVKLKENLATAMSVYINRVDGAPCGDSENGIRLMKGSDNAHATYLQERRQALLIFLSGSQKAKEELENSNPTQYKYFCEIWDVRNNHMVVDDKVKKYVFVLLPCYKKECIHAICKNGKPEDEEFWNANKKDLPLSKLPFPIADKSRPWGWKDCKNCRGFCAGHYLSPEKCIEHVKRNGVKECLPPPSFVLKEAFQKAEKDKKDINDEITDLAKKTLLAVEDVKIWIKHLIDVKERKKEGAKKASMTRAKKKKGMRNAYFNLF